MGDKRILVEGSRGKSGIIEILTNLINNRGRDAIGKITGKETSIIYKNKKHPLKRKRKIVFIEDENKKVLSDYSDVEYKIFENQALSSYTMYVVHKIVKPEIVLIPNIRYEHQDRLGDTLQQISKSFAVNFKGLKKVITTETKLEVLEVFEKYCKKYDVELISLINEEKIPSENIIYLLDRTLKELNLNRLTNQEIKNIYKKLKENMSLKNSTSKKINYFNGAKVNDVESTKNVFNYLLKHNPKKDFTFICYLRKDRPERTESFINYFEDLNNHQQVKSIYFTGSGLKQFKTLSKFHKIKNLKPSEIINLAKEDNTVLFMAINGVNKFMLELEEILEKKEIK